MTVCADGNGLGSALLGAPLDLHEGIAADDALERLARAEFEVGEGCPRWPADLRLQSSCGALVPGRCKATNLCPYCARLAAVVNAEVLAQDVAMGNVAPTLWSVTTTRTATIDTGAFRRAREAVFRAVRREWDHVEAASILEFSTGYGTRSGGKRRPHWNDAWKGIPAAEAADLEEVIALAWCQGRDGARGRARVDAERDGQKVTPIAEVGGLMRYLALHFQKESQQPPAGWRGHRFRTTRGYLAEPMPAMRERALAHLRYRRELRRAEVEGFEGDELEHVVRDRLADAAALTWELVRRQPIPATFGEDGQPATWTDVLMPVGRQT